MVVAAGQHLDEAESFSFVAVEEAMDQVRWQLLKDLKTHHNEVMSNAWT